MINLLTYICVLIFSEFRVTYGDVYWKYPEKKVAYFAYFSCNKILYETKSDIESNFMNNNLDNEIMLLIFRIHVAEVATCAP